MRILDVCEADKENDYIAICWMRSVGAVWAPRYDLRVMELWCRRHCVARVPALMFDTSLVGARASWLRPQPDKI